jgi:hypothetical protein
MLAMQVSVVLTANYGFFNYLSTALLLWALDDGHLVRAAARLGWTLRPPPARAPSRVRTAALAAVVAVLVPLSVVQFVPFVPALRDLDQRLFPLRRTLNGVRSVNAYHLFARMTLVRREVMIEGSTDGVTWLPYEFRYKPGDPDRAPPFVAPHQPRVDFQLWFLLLGRPGARYFDRLIARLLTAPDVVRPLFAEDPFPATPPRLVRIGIYRYRFTAWGEGDRRAWWRRDFERTLGPFDAARVGGGG